jgi:choline-sulfatase
MGHRSGEEGGEAVRTPNFDALAAQGTVFTDAYCQMPLCTPSRICLLTGREVRGCGAWSNESVLRPELPTLPGVLSEAGYRTALIGKMHLGGNRQFVGFHDRPYGDLTGKTGHQWEPLDDFQRKAMRARTQKAGVTEIPESMIQDEIVAHETVAYLREQAHLEPERPWFLCASFSRPHFPLTAPRRHFEPYLREGVSEPAVPAAGDAFDHPMSVGMREGFLAEQIGSEETMRARAAYFACVSYLDEVIGDLLMRLQASGLLDNTIIVYTSDHGEMAGEHGVWWKNGWYEACTRIPLIVSTAEQRRGTKDASLCRTPVGLVDLFPTLCSLAGAPSPIELNGIDLSGSLGTGREPPDRPIFFDVLRPRWGAGTEFRGIRWRNFKYVRFRDAEPLLFDLASDPGEQFNLLARGVSGEAEGAKAMLEGIARQTMDFEAAEQERTIRDGSLEEKYAQELPPSTGNLYLMPSGKLVNAEDPLYNPTTIAESPEIAFGDLPADRLVRRR